MRVAAALLTGVLLLSACTATAPTRTVLPTSTSPATSPVAPASSTTSLLPTQTASPIPAPPYTGTKPMPTSDGKPMLWAAGSTVSVEDKWGRTQTTRYGFIDVTGKLVVSPRYENYEYCTDDAGRAAELIGSATGRKANVLDLTGRVVATLPTPEARCGTPGTVIFSHWFDQELGHHRDGLLDLATGKVLLPMVRGRVISVVDNSTLDVSDPGGAYFLNPRTGVRTPHVGWLAHDTGLEAGAPGIPAAKKRGSEGNPADEGPFGFIDTHGKWIAQPYLAEASGFTHGYAVVQPDDEHYTFLNSQLQQVGGQWDEVEPVYVDSFAGSDVVGYLVDGSTGRALLSSDLRTIIKPGSGSLVCLSYADGACSVTDRDGLTSLVVLPAGTVTPMPAGFTQAISATFVADRRASNDFAVQRILSVSTGTSTPFDAARTCQGAGAAFVACVQNSANVPTSVVVDAQGRQTAFGGVEVAYQPVVGGGPAYYWVTTARYQGYVDKSGHWLYRAGRYTELED